MMIKNSVRQRTKHCKNKTAKTKLKKTDIESIVKDIPMLGSSQTIGDAGALANVQIMGKEVFIDLLMQSPSLQSRKKIELHVGTALKEKLSDDLYEDGEII